MRRYRNMSLAPPSGTLSQYACSPPVAENGLLHPVASHMASMVVIFHSFFGGGAGVGLGGAGAGANESKRKLYRMRACGINPPVSAR